MKDKIKLLEEAIESCTDRYADNRIEIAKALSLLNEISQDIDRIRLATPKEIEEAKFKKEFPYEVGDVCEVWDGEESNRYVSIYKGKGYFDRCVQHKGGYRYNHHKLYEK